MAVAHGPVGPPLSPTIMPEQSFSGDHEPQRRTSNPIASGLPGGMVLNAPHVSSTPFTTKSLEPFPPTPQSAAMPQQASHHPHLQKHIGDYGYSPASSAHSHSHPSPFRPPPLAGPSTYRRTPNIVSPMSINGSEMHSRGMISDHSSPAKRTREKPSHGEQVMMDGMERMVVDEGDGRIGVEDPFAERSYTELKCLGDGSFGTVWLCDWHSPLRPDTVLSAMQCGAGARPEWVGKRLVALKRMKRVWDGGWSQAKNLGEIHSLSRIPQHHAIIPLLDAFISPKSRELYFVFECMEGNLYQLTKSRKGRPMAAGLIASCFHQISSGLHHIHRHGYFHRDMKPENLLVTTTGLADYLTASALHQINTSRTGALPDELARGHDGRELPRYEKDVSVIVKLADFGLARATESKPPYTEYVSTRWYRAPEVLLRSTEYGPPVDMWALGTILAEMLNLKPLFPGVSEIDQVYRITETLGDPATDYGVDERDRIIGGGIWVSGIKLAKNVGFSFPKRKPVHFRSLFSENVPQSLIDCISDLLRYNPKIRMTSAQCIEHPYFLETIPHLQQTPPIPRIPFSQGQPPPRAAPRPIEIAPLSRPLPPSHAHHEPRPAFGDGDMRTLPPPIGTPDTIHRDIFPHNASTERFGPSALVSQLRELDLPTEDLHSYGHRPPLAIEKDDQMYALGQDPSSTSVNQRTRAWAEEAGRRASNGQPSVHGGSAVDVSDNAASTTSINRFDASQQSLVSATSTGHAQIRAQQHLRAYESEPARPVYQSQQHLPTEPPRGTSTTNLPNQSTSKLSAVISGKKKKWGMSNIFGGGDKSMASLPPVEEVTYTGASSLKRTQSGNNPSSRGLAMSAPPPPAPIDDQKLSKKETEKAKREAEKLKREAAARMQKERARAVMQKRQNMMAAKPGMDIDHSESFSQIQEITPPRPRPEQPAPNPREERSSPQMPASHSLLSFHSQANLSDGSRHSIHSGQSRSHPQLPVTNTSAYDNAGRHKARRRDVDDDHSMSSFDHNSLRSRSVLTVGTIDSDPGPMRSRPDLHDPRMSHAYAKDPLYSKRIPSVASFRQPGHPSKLATMSNPSLESQLAHDFMARANVASSSSLAPLPPTSSSSFGAALGSTQGSAPTSPYGHPKGDAVARGVGMGRVSAGDGRNVGGLPSISTWDAAEEGINPMFMVPSAMSRHPDAHPGATLPPFADIARVADSSARRQG